MRAKPADAHCKFVRRQRKPCQGEEMRQEVASRVDCDDETFADEIEALPRAAARRRPQAIEYGDSRR